ncbi:disulfide bond formation protein B [Kushneria phosphatilytica]|uniref:Disulfide bond formation protein B n=1 Tax=Kushneria phosphatilytica TaxID=657387 RepID=A0A1S1NU42_9GAMM|nr:disulfide bond formation protein B [Kushneria phosphatilytica]OHV09711.1 disulfide bond formation protein DsbB [Kushneria phosphatilytica]QEL11757.1 disulfide bond formation protein B [Kushneria phosphatilytica]
MAFMSGASCRRWSLLGAGVCIFMLAMALIMQFGFGLEPCPLCIFQRVAVLVALLGFLIGICHDAGRAGRIVYGGIALLGSIAGALVAGRHVWIQRLPEDQVPSCGPGLDYMLDALPIQSVITQVLRGSGECANISARWLGLTLPGWTLIGFVVLILIALGLMFGRHFGAGKGGRQHPSLTGSEA